MRIRLNALLQTREPRHRTQLEHVAGCSELSAQGAATSSCVSYITQLVGPTLPWLQACDVTARAACLTLSMPHDKDKPFILYPGRFSYYWLAVVCVSASFMGIRYAIS